MRVGIIGAGISGLAAARDLKAHGHETVIFEKSRGVGGRCMTRTKAAYRWDTGATSIAPRGKRIQTVMLNELSQDELIKLSKPIYAHSALHVSPGDPRKNVDRYVYRDGISTFAKLIASELNVKTESPIDELKRVGTGYSVNGETFDAVILTPPMPQAAMLLWSLSEIRPITNVRYRSSISIMLAFDTPMPPVPYFAIIEVDQAHPLIWLSIESEKSPTRAPEGHTLMTLQLNPTFSTAYYDRDDDWLVELATNFVHKLYPNKFNDPVESDIMKWKYASPETLATFENANADHKNLIVTGDAFLGGRIEDAYEIGLRASELLREAS